MATKKAAEEKVEVKKPVEKKAPVKAETKKAEPVKAAEAAKPAEKKAPVKKPAAKKPAAKKAAEVIIQSALGGEITPEAVLEKVGSVDKVYVRVDQNKAYWGRGEETGSVDLW